MNRYTSNNGRSFGKSVGRSVASRAATRAAARAATRAAPRSAPRSLPKIASRSASLVGAAATVAAGESTVSGFGSIMEHLKSPWVLLGICIIAGLVYYFFVYRKQQEIDQARQEREERYPSESDSRSPKEISPEEWEQIQMYHAQQQAAQKAAQQAAQQQAQTKPPKSQKSSQPPPSDEEIMPQISQSPPQEEGSDEETELESNFPETPNNEPSDHQQSE